MNISGNGGIDELSLGSKRSCSYSGDQSINTAEGRCKRGNIVVIYFLDCNSRWEASGARFTCEDCDIEGIGCYKLFEDWGADVSRGL